MVNIIGEFEEVSGVLFFLLVLVYVKLVLLGLIMCVSLVGNVILFLLVFKERVLYKVFYYFLLDLCLVDGIRFVVCFFFVLVFVRYGFLWIFSAFSCKIVVFMVVFFCFYAVFMLFCISVIRYMVIVYYRFYVKRMIFWICVVVICMVWILFVVMVFLFVFDVGIYKFIREED